MGGCANPQLVRSVMDGCNWLANIPGYPLKKTMQTIAKIVVEGSGVGGAPLSNHPDTLSTCHPTPMTIPVPTIPAQADGTFRLLHRHGLHCLKRNSYMHF